MIFTDTPLDGAKVIELEPARDQRGWFARTFDADLFRERGLHPAIVQCSTSFNERTGTLRGMHYQEEPHGEPKLVRCTRGAVFDVIVDLRPESQTYCGWFGIELAPDGGKMVYIPSGFAHGFQTLVDASEVHYQMGYEYVPEAALGVRWDDPAIGITWPATEERIISERDRGFPDFVP